MIFVGIDDTDTLDSPGTNQVARALVARIANRFRCRLIIRHQLLFDPRVPYTSKNSAATLLFEPGAQECHEPLIAELRNALQENSAPGSDPGLCVAERVPESVSRFGLRCQQEVVDQSEARQLSAACGIYLEGLAGTQDGVIGALAAIGLAATGNDGRVVNIGTWPDDLSGPQDVDVLRSRGVEVHDIQRDEPIEHGLVDVGKHLRPNYRRGNIVQFVEPDSSTSIWKAVRLT